MKNHKFLLTETLLQTNSDVGIGGYTFFGRARCGKKGGGVGILIQNELKNIYTPLISERPIEMIWIAVRQKNRKPLMIGCYYGKQESRCSKDEIVEEINLLAEEIEEYKKEGETIIFIDGNGKLGILGEEKSRNGKLLDALFDEHSLTVMNRSNKCIGKVTRHGTTNDDEKSAIDFVVAGKEIEQDIKSMKIDEEGLLKIRGDKCTDHNTITLHLIVKSIERMKQTKMTNWRLNAPEQYWIKFRRELDRFGNEVQDILDSESDTLAQKYKKWMKGIETAARISFGKTTVKLNSNEKFSQKVKDMNGETKPKKRVKRR